jgi:tetratricopeptide (TPR) repeat protein
MKRVAIIAALLGLATGCQTSVTQERHNATKKWHRARAQVVCSVGQECLRLGQLGKAMGQAQEALALDPDLTEARMLLSKVLIEEGRYDLAIVELEGVLTNHPKLAEAVYLLGVAQEKSLRMAQALESYRRSHVMDPSSLAGVTAATEVLVAMGRTSEAYDYIKKYLGVAGNHPRVYELAGRAAMMLGLHEEAAIHYETALDLDPKNMPYREALGRASFFAGRYDAAAEVLEGLTDTDGYRAPSSVYTMLGDCYLALGRGYAARDAYFTASEMSPATPDVWTDLAKGCLAIGDLKRARLSARQALQLDGNNLDAALLFGYALLRQGQSARAVAFLTEAAARHRQSATLVCLLGRAHAAAGDPVRAAECYAEALRLDPGNNLARQLLQACEKRISMAGTETR